ncbi:anti-phage-associated DUF1156 domain-containing protein [Labrenzia sp. OB1]|uniref:anti-phage-associated DUF1156 domain-containing protein n=1 Tax=Labrenzia sp. OB1 TaxID=1561204 RepID=UPI0007B2AFBA|nr:anti-phage-associated DUF1156 domain-containing protein [Labrenzia sp. OB1]KZM50776.1 DNA methylase [Labrenzia sp. OB1]
MKDLRPLALKDAPALIEAVFPAQKVSFEAQRERKAGAGQTLTTLGSYWKGRKPLILVRAIVLGSLLPQTGDDEKDLEIFEKLMAFDDHGLARRAFAQNDLKPKQIAARITLSNPWDYFTFTGYKNLPVGERLLNLECPFDADEEGISLRWDRNTSDEAKLQLIEQTLATLDSYEEKSSFCKRPEEVDQSWLFAPIWPAVNNHYKQFGITVSSMPELIESIGQLRYGHRPRVSDTFCGGGSIPFEASRLGADTFSSDLNPIAAMLTWGALNSLGATPQFRAEIAASQRAVALAVEQELSNLGVEQDGRGNRAKAYLYCLETRCPETGWLVPISSSWIISKTRNVVAKLVPNATEKRFDIILKSQANSSDMKIANTGTLQGGHLVYEIAGRTYRTSIKTLRGDYRDGNGGTQNKLRLWEKNEFTPKSSDLFQERLYAIHWVQEDTIGKGREVAFFSSPQEEDLTREQRVKRIVSENLENWQKLGLVPDMKIERGYNTDQPIRERGWTYWHHLFSPRDLLGIATYAKQVRAQKKELVPHLYLSIPMVTDNASKLCGWNPGHPGSGEFTTNVFNNQALNTHYNYSCRCVTHISRKLVGRSNDKLIGIAGTHQVRTASADQLDFEADLFVTDPPYADAVHYHEITEFFIAWLRKSPPEPFDTWVWDSRRALAIKGAGDEFRRGMVDAYRAMTEHMPDNGMQCVMFTHQDTRVWSDMVGIFWAAGLQVVAAWYIATETTSELKKGGYVQGTVILMLRKRPAGERAGFKQRILPAVRAEVERQIESMMHLNDEVKDKLGEPVFNDSDLQMAGYAAALKVLTAYTHIGGEDVTSFALRPRQKGEVTVVDEIVQQAAEAANSLLVPGGLQAETWSRLTGIQRFYFRMMDMETTGARKLDNYQNFAKAFRVADYGKVMGNMAANSARLKRVTEFASRDLTDSTEIGPTWLGRLIMGFQQLLAEVEPAVVVSQIQEDIPEFFEVRVLLIDMLAFIERKVPEQEVRDAAEVLGGRLKNLRAFSQ